MSYSWLTQMRFCLNCKKCLCLGSFRNNVLKITNPSVMVGIKHHQCPSKEFMNLWSDFIAVRENMFVNVKGKNEPCKEP